MTSGIPTLSISNPIQRSISSISSFCQRSNPPSRINSNHQFHSIQSREFHIHSHHQKSNNYAPFVPSSTSTSTSNADSDPSASVYASSIDFIELDGRDPRGPISQEESIQYQRHAEILSGQQSRGMDSTLSLFSRNIPKDSFNSTADSVWKSSSNRDSDLVEIEPDPTPEFDPLESNLGFLQAQQSFSDNPNTANLLSTPKSMKDSGSRAAMSLRAGSRRNFHTSSPRLSSSFSPSIFQGNSNSSTNPQSMAKVPSSSREAHTAASPSRNQDQNYGGSHPSSSSSSNSNLDLSFPSHLKNPDPYQIFHLPKKASQKQIKERYFDLVRTLHPDKLSSRKGKERSSGADDKDVKQVEEEFKIVISAYELLSNASRRRTYDLSGYGWRDGTSSNQPNSWNGKTPRNQDEWRAYQEWSDSLRRSGGRGSPNGFTSGYNYGFRGGHDGFGWQQYANNSQNKDQGSRFYGFASTHPGGGGGDSNSSFTSNGQPRQKPIYTSNTKFFSSIFILTWTLGYFQYERLQAQSERAIKRADLNHLDAAINLDKAREEARSEEGRLRREAWRKKVRELGAAPSDGGSNGGERLALQEGAGEFGIGRGGPSGKAAAEERNRKAKLRMGD